MRSRPRRICCKSMKSMDKGSIGVASVLDQILDGISKQPHIKTTFSLGVTIPR